MVRVKPSVIIGNTYFVRLSTSRYKMSRKLFYTTCLFGVLDSLTTYYGLSNQLAREGSFAVQYMIDKLGLVPGLILRTLIMFGIVYVLHAIPEKFNPIKTIGQVAALTLNVLVVINNIYINIPG